MGRKLNLKKYFIRTVVLLSIFLFLGQRCFSESTPSTILLGDSQHFDLQSPNTIPFDSTREVIKQMKENECDKGVVLFFNTNKRIEVQPTLNGALFGPEVIIDPETMFLAGEFDLVTRNLQTMQKLDPITDMLGIFFHFDTADGNAVFDAAFYVKPNCFSPSPGISMSDMIDHSLPPVYFQDSMPGVLILNDNAYSLRLGYALSSESIAKRVIELEKLSGVAPDLTFSPTTAIEYLMSSLTELENLRSMLEESNLMVGMTLIQEKLQECIEKDSEAIMLLEEIKDRTPGVELLADGAFTTAVTTANRLISEAIRCKKMVIGKLQRVEPSMGQHSE